MEPAWWQLMLQYGAAPTLVAALSVVALVIQNRTNEKREDQRRRDDAAEQAKSREHQAEQAKAEREHQLQMVRDQRDHDAWKSTDANLAAQSERHRDRVYQLNERWRDERKEAHIDLLAVIDRAIQVMDNSILDLPSDDDNRTIRGDEPVNSLNQEHRESLRQSLVSVQVVASEESKRKAEECVKAIQVLDLSIWSASLIPSDKGKIQSQMTDSERLRREYMESVRSDLGTNASETEMGPHLPLSWPDSPNERDPWGDS